MAAPLMGKLARKILRFIIISFGFVVGKYNVV